MKKLLILLVFIGLVSSQDKYEFHRILPTSEMLTPSLNIYASYGWEFVQETRIVISIEGKGNTQAHQVILKRSYSRDYDWTKKRILKDSHIRDLAQIVDSQYWIRTKDNLTESMGRHFGIVYDPSFKDIPHWSDPTRQSRELKVQIDSQQIFDEETLDQLKEKMEELSGNPLKEKADIIKDNSN